MLTPKAADIIADVATVSANWYVFRLKDFAAQPSKKWLVYLGFSSNLCTVLIAIAFWVVYMVASPDSYMLFVCFTNAVVGFLFVFYLLGSLLNCPRLTDRHI